jgi:molybdenum cofactor cytidylyltransferase
MNPDFGRIALVLLAAGQSRRFGGAKLRALLRGKPLAHHVAESLGALPFAGRYAVTGADDLGLADFGFNIVRGDTSAKSGSLSAGVSAARSLRPYGIMVALADMPFVPTPHFERLVREFDGDRIASTDATIPMPPAIFGEAHFDALVRSGGDDGARTLITSAPLVRAESDYLRDIDTPEQLTAAHQGGTAA